jgi:SAM-dependent methyltransferase
MQLSDDLLQIETLAPGSSPRCLHCDSQRVANVDAAQVWVVYESSYTLLCCQDCGGQFTYPSPSPATLSRLYKEGFAYKWYRDMYPAKFVDSLHRMVQYSRLRALRPGPILDYGGGIGYFSAAARLCGYPAETRDPMYEQSDSHGSSANRATLEPYQTVACHHVLEHAIAPLDMLADIHSRLLPGGQLIIAVPNGRSLGYRKLGVRWTWAQPPLIHLHHFTPEGMHSLLSRSGFRIVQEHFFERWDANAVADVALDKLFLRWDGRWGQSRWQWATAQSNSLRRFLALSAAQLRGLLRPNPLDRAELLIVAERQD